MRNHSKTSIESEYLSHSMTKPIKWPARPAKTQISLGIHTVWSEPRLFAVCMKKPCVLSYRMSARRRLWSDWPDALVWSCRISYTCKKADVLVINTKMKTTGTLKSDNWNCCSLNCLLLEITTSIIMIIEVSIWCIVKKQQQQQKKKKKR